MEERNRFSASNASVEFVRRRLLALLASSALPLPPPRRLALMEACREAEDSPELLDMCLEALGDSTYLPPEVKDRVMDGVMTGDWEAVQNMVNASNCSLPPQDPLRGNNSHKNAGSCFMDLRRMAITIFYASRKIQQLPLEARRRLGSAILRTRSREALMNLFLTRLESANTLDQQARILIANDVLEKRYYRLLLPDRFDCSETGPFHPQWQAEGIRVTGNHDRTNSSVGTSSPSSPPSPYLEVEHVWIDENTQECPICLSPVDCPTTLPCQHVFCRDCILDWATQGDSDPPSSSRSRGSSRATARHGTTGSNHRHRHQSQSQDVSVSCPLCRQTGQVPPNMSNQDDSTLPTIMLSYISNFGIFNTRF